MEVYVRSTRTSGSFNRTVHIKRIFATASSKTFSSSCLNSIDFVFVRVNIYRYRYRYQYSFIYLFIDYFFFFN